MATGEDSMSDTEDRGVEQATQDAYEAGKQAARESRPMANPYSPPHNALHPLLASWWHRGYTFIEARRNELRRTP